MGSRKFQALNNLKISLRRKQSLNLRILLHIIPIIIRCLSSNTKAFESYSSFTLVISNFKRYTKQHQAISLIGNASVSMSSEQFLIVLKESQKFLCLITPSLGIFFSKRIIFNNFCLKILYKNFYPDTVKRKKPKKAG